MSPTHQALLRDQSRNQPGSLTMGRIQCQQALTISSSLTDLWPGTQALAGGPPCYSQREVRNILVLESGKAWPKFWLCHLAPCHHLSEPHFLL